MKQFYLFYNQSDKILPQIGADFENEFLPQLGTKFEKMQLSEN